MHQIKQLVIVKGVLGVIVGILGIVAGVLRVDAGIGVVHRVVVGIGILN